jgi:hypothetical protein
MAPNKPWFIRRSGPMRYRITPYAWQGWAISAVFVALMGLNLGPSPRRQRPRRHDRAHGNPAGSVPRHCGAFFRFGKVAEWC